MTITQLRTLRRAGLEPAAVELVEELPKRLKLRDKSSGIIFYINKDKNPKRLGEENNNKGDKNMSTEEMEVLDQEVMGVVNGKGTIPQPPAVTAPFTQGVQNAPHNDGEKKAAEKPFWKQVEDETEKLAKKYERRRQISALAWLVVCVVAVAALILTLYVPAALPWVVNIGVMCFIVAAAIIADRNIRRWLM